MRLDCCCMFNTVMLLASWGIVLVVKISFLSMCMFTTRALTSFSLAGEFFHSAQRSATAQQRETESQQIGGESLDTPLLNEDGFSNDSSKILQLRFFTGLVPRDKYMAFERILFRATRGNVFLRQVAIDNPVTDSASGEKGNKKTSLVGSFI